MPFPHSPDQLAAELYLGKDGTYRRTPIPMARVDQVIREKMGYAKSIDHDADAQDAFREEFNAKYLPALANATLDHPSDDFRSACKAIYGFMASFYGLYIRFIHFHSDIVLRWLALNLSDVVFNFRNLQIIERQAPQHKLIAMRQVVLLLADVGDEWIKLSRQLPESPIFPVVPAQVRSGMIELAARCRTDADFNALWSDADSTHDLATVLRNVVGLCKGEGNQMLEVEQAQREARQVGRPEAWWSCELRRIGRARDACVPLEGEQGYSVCGKCTSVRYCFTRDEDGQIVSAHRKADWKRHKHKCFEPLW